jgi:hypothetical protein
MDAWRPPRRYSRQGTSFVLSVSNEGPIAMRTLLLAAAVVVALSSVVRAERAGTAMMADGHVVHSRRGAVIFHRALPPFRGVHVYQGRR